MIRQTTRLLTITYGTNLNRNASKDLDGDLNLLSSADACQSAVGDCFLAPQAVQLCQQALSQRPLPARSSGLPRLKSAASRRCSHG